MATVVRQVKRYQPSDWYTDAFTQSTNADHTRSAAHDIHQEARFLRNETDCQTKWDQYATDVRLSDRVNHLRKMKETMERILGQLDQEIADLSEAKENCENEIEIINLRTDVAIECLTLREGRRKIEVVADDPENQLHKEVEVIEGAKKSLQQKISEAFEQLCLLQEARQQAEQDIKDKGIAISIDIDQYNLSDRSPGLTYKPDALRVPKESQTLVQWEECSRFYREKAEAELKSSTRLREQIHNMLHKIKNELDAQKQATEFAFRKRIHESQRAKDEMSWHKEKIEEEIADLENDIRGLEETIRKRSRAIMKAETRLENRLCRPNVEMCRGAVHYGLVDEVKQLHASSNALEEKLNQAQQILDGLQKSLNSVNDDIALKSQTLQLDKKCLDIRQKLNPPAKSETENNLLLTGIERMKSTTLA